MRFAREHPRDLIGSGEPARVGTHNPTGLVPQCHRRHPPTRAKIDQSSCSARRQDPPPKLLTTM
jgi:hypothetical protein